MKNLQTQNLTVYNLSPTGPGQGAPQTNLELFLGGFFLVVLWQQQLGNYSKCIIGLGKEVNSLMFLGAKTLPIQE